ncbi:MAG: bifunctional hydroxymethylpyrimidine kinase/phosphomethylpyrimidine kinase [Acidobacteria bacterium]|nr:MAG: bifunctional hydroxymethylpyrimidine kinase/phosphomethylpyrimidine kinase [Acidobacteriota bacterium]
MVKPAVLTIAGSDSGGGAGIQGDLKTFAALGVYGLSVVTSITAQNTQGVRRVFDLPAELVIDQLRAVLEDIEIHAVKTGMLSNREIIEAVGKTLETHHLRPLVVDPVMRAKSGDPLMAPEAEQALIEILLPQATVVTPNIPEAERLTGLRIGTREDMREAARVIQQMGAQAVLIKGGHLSVAREAIDILLAGGEFHEFSAERIATPSGVHGTGCAFASAIAAGLARGYSLVEAVSRAKRYITGAIRRSYRVGLGHPVLDHSWESGGGEDR